MRQLFFLYYLIFSINVLCCIHHFMFHIPNFRFISASTSSAGLLITQILSVQFSKLLRYFLHTRDWFIIFIHDAFLQN